MSDTTPTRTPRTPAPRGRSLVPSIALRDDQLTYLLRRLGEQASTAQHGSRFIDRYADWYLDHVARTTIERAGREAAEDIGLDVPDSVPITGWLAFLYQQRHHLAHYEKYAQLAEKLQSILKEIDPDGRETLQRDMRHIREKHYEKPPRRKNRTNPRSGSPRWVRDDIQVMAISGLSILVVMLAVALAILLV